MKAALAPRCGSSVRGNLVNGKFTIEEEVMRKTLEISAGAAAHQPLSA